MQQPLNRFLLLQPAWLPTVLFIPLLYALGWLAAVPLTLLGLPTDQLSLTGTVLSFVLFLLVMPRWAALRWSEITALGGPGHPRSQTTGTTRPSSCSSQRSAHCRRAADGDHECCSDRWIGELAGRSGCNSADECRVALPRRWLRRRIDFPQLALDGTARNDWLASCSLGSSQASSASFTHASTWGWGPWVAC